MSLLFKTVVFETVGNHKFVIIINATMQKCKNMEFKIIRLVQVPKILVGHTCWWGVLKINQYLPENIPSLGITSVFGHLPSYNVHPKPTFSANAESTVPFIWRWMACSVSNFHAED